MSRYDLTDFEWRAIQPAGAMLPTDKGNDANALRCGHLPAQGLGPTSRPRPTARTRSAPAYTPTRCVI